jgi:hypothetical protein
MIGNNKYIEVISVNAPEADPCTLRLERYLIDRDNYTTLNVRSALYARRINATLHTPYIFQAESDRLLNVSLDLDIIACFLNGPTIIAVGNEVQAAEIRIINAINRSPILPQRT